MVTRLRRGRATRGGGGSAGPDMATWGGISAGPDLACHVGSFEALLTFGSGAHFLAPSYTFSHLLAPSRAHLLNFGEWVACDAR